MSYPVTLCCLLADPTVAWQDWQPGFYQVEVAELDTDGHVDPAVAREFAELIIDREGLAVGRTQVDLLVCTMHHGHDVTRAPRITRADQEVDEREEIARYPDATPWTVCGMFLDTGQCYSDSWAAHGPRHAFGLAWNHCQSEYDRYLVVSCVHPGDEPRAEESPTWADTRCDTEGAMADRLDELMPERQ